MTILTGLVSNCAFCQSQTRCSSRSDTKFLAIMEQLEYQCAKARTSNCASSSSAGQHERGTCARWRQLRKILCARTSMDVVTSFSDARAAGNRSALVPAARDCPWSPAREKARKRAARAVGDSLTVCSERLPESARWSVSYVEASKPTPRIAPGPEPEPGNSKKVLG